MMIPLEEIPVAYSMVALTRQSFPQPISAREALDASRHVYQTYMCYWTAFNNIYTTVHDKVGQPKADYARDRVRKTVKMDFVANRRMLKVKIPPEREQLNTVRTEFDRKLRYDLANHDSTRFFVTRTPRWKNQRLEIDKFGQQLNGVINIGRTLSRNYPVWSPIDVDAYMQYIDRHDEDEDVPDDLIKQIVDILYTVRNNLFHGGKRAHDENDIEVVEKALPLLSMIVESFLIPYREDIPA